MLIQCTSTAWPHTLVFETDFAVAAKWFKFWMTFLTNANGVCFEVGNGYNFPTTAVNQKEVDGLAALTSSLPFVLDAFQLSSILWGANYKLRGKAKFCSA